MGKSKGKADPAAAAAAVPPYPFFAKSEDECFAKLECGPDHGASGLSSDEAAARLDKFGPNTLTAKARKTIWQRIWHHVANMLVGILIVVAIVSVARAFTSTTVDNIVSNALQAALIVLVITYVTTKDRAKNKSSSLRPSILALIRLVFFCRVVC
jgi:magnesium-transporting ATPase (P-type)